MAKKKKKDNKLISFIVFALGLLATLTIFLPALATGSGDNQVFYSGLDISFGKTLTDLGTLVNAKIPFNILAVVAYILPFVGGILILLSERKDKVLKLVSIILFLGSAVLLFLLPSYIEVITESGLFGGSMTEKLSDNLAWGSIAGGSLSILALLGSAYKLVK